jgi:phytol kinase
MTDLIFTSFSFFFVFLLLGLSSFLQKKGLLDDEGSRKLVHIGVAHWWFFLIFIDGLLYASIAPIAFIFLNYLSYKQNIFKSIERSGKGNLGTVYFPISLLILVLMTYLVEPSKSLNYIGALGILILGYGDGFAAIIGKKFGKTKLIFGKSLEGSITFYVASLLVVIVVLFIYQPMLSNTLLIVLLLPLFATLIELITPAGLDNLTIPLGVAAIAYVFHFLG